MNKKKIVRFFLEGILLISCIIGFVIINEQINDNKRHSFKVIPDSNSYAYQVEEAKEEGATYVIKGWFFELKNVRNEKIDFKDNKHFGVALYDLSNASNNMDTKNNCIPLTIEYIIREDINEYFKCEYDYSKCGFVARIDKNDIDLEKGKYQIVVKPDDEDLSGIKIQAYIDCGHLRYINTEDAFDLECDGTDLEIIVNDGVCLFNNLKNNICIYQYDNKLYWIAGEKFDFDTDGSTFISYNIDTTQYNNLPKDLVDKGMYYNYRGGAFESYEITDDIDCGKYRVSMRELPADHSVFYVETGYYNKSWIWHCFIRPVFLYK